MVDQSGEGGPGINHVRELEESRRDKWPGSPSAFRLWISHYRMRGASHLYTAAQHGRDRPCTYIPLIMNAVAVGDSSISVAELFLLSCIEAPGLWYTELSLTYISRSGSLFAEATNKCINAASIFKRLFLLLLQDNVSPLSNAGKNTNLNRKALS